MTTATFPTSPAIDYVSCTLPNASDLFAGYPVEAMEAIHTGLAYVQCAGSYTVVHMASQQPVVSDWFVGSEELARKWIKGLVALADWRGSVPVIRDAACLQELFQFACIGMLTEGNYSVSCISSTVC